MSHWYTQHGKPLYQVHDKSGRFRDTTLRDARERNLVPSVTTVMDIIAKPGLEIWKQQQVLMSALTLPRKDNEPLDAFAKRVIADSMKEADAAAEQGAKIHNAVEFYYRTGKIRKGYKKYVVAVASLLYELFGEQPWKAETSFSSPCGWGGRVDLDCPAVIVDFKTKDFDASTPISKLAYRQQAVQLAAYRRGRNHKNAILVNVYISRTVPGLVKYKVWPPSNYLREYNHIFKLWCIMKNYNPGFEK